jgi:2,3-bisphosphoglycerate-dependent phosphoglycerate mutase
LLKESIKGWSDHMALVYLVRHAHVSPIEGQPAADWPLSERGRQQAEAIALLPFWKEVRAIYCSPESKAQATVAPAAARHGLAVTTVAALRELERPLGLLPDYQGAVAACFAQPEVSVGGFEPAGQVRRRMTEAIFRFAEQQEGPIAIVSHGLSFSLFLAGLQGKAAPTLEEWRSIPMPGWALYELPAGRAITPFTAI